MRRQRNFLPFIALAAAVATPALGQTGTSGGGPESGETNGAASIPDFSRVWNHPAFPWFEPPASGPGPITNKSRWPQEPGDPASGTLALVAGPGAVVIVILTPLGIEAKGAVFGTARVPQPAEPKTAGSPVLLST